MLKPGSPDSDGWTKLSWQMRDVLCAPDATLTESSSGAEAMQLLSEFLTDAEQRRAKLEKQLAAADEFIGLLGDHIRA